MIVHDLLIQVLLNLIGFDLNWILDGIPMLNSI